MKALQLVRRRANNADDRFAEIVIWQLKQPLPGSSHLFKYRLAYVIDEHCVLRYDNESGKADHRHVNNKESRYAFLSIEALLSAFEMDIRRMNDENRGA